MQLSIITPSLPCYAEGRGLPQFLLFICRLVNCLPITLGGADAAAGLWLEVL